MNSKNPLNQIIKAATPVIAEAAGDLAGAAAIETGPIGAYAVRNITTRVVRNKLQKLTNEG